MTFSPEDSLALLAILAVVALLLVAAERTSIPYPILLVVGGLGLGFIPGIPEFQLPPDLVLVAVLPPLLYGAAFFTSLRDLRENAFAITLLAIGLVLSTMLIVAVVAHELIPGLSWGVAFVLGAVVSPTDPTAATAIAERLGLPRRLVALIEGESLVNDGTALVAYKFAVIAVVSGSFSMSEAAGSFALNVVGGIAVGLGVGFVVRHVRRKIEDPALAITLSLMSGYFAYLPAIAIGVSGVLAAVTIGIYMGWYTPELTTWQTRLQGIAVWEITFFILNALLFALIGLQLPVIVDALSGYSPARLVGYAAVVSLAVIGARFLWVIPGTYLTAWMRRSQAPDPEPGPRLDHPRLGGDARGSLARRCARAAADDGRGRRLPEPRPRHLPHVRGDPRLARRAGPLLPRAAQAGRDRGRRPHGEGGEQGAHLRHRGRSRAAGGARGRGLGARRHARAASARCSTSATSASAAASTRSRTARSRTVRSTTSGSFASCSPPSGTRSSTCAASGESTMSSCAASSATSTSRKPGSMADLELVLPAALFVAAP